AAGEGLALATNRQRHARIDSGRNVETHLDLARLHSLAVAGAALLIHDSAATAALVAGRLNCKETAGQPDGSGALALRASTRLAAGGGAIAGARLAEFAALELNVRFRAAECLFQVELIPHADVAPAVARTAITASAAEERVKDIAEN